MMQILIINLELFYYITIADIPYRINASQLQVLPILFRYLSTLELENALRRSRLEAEVAASRVIAEEDLRRSRLQN